MNGNLIESYKDIAKEIDKVILKKKADIVMAGESKKWEQAYNDQQSALVDQATAYHALEDAAKQMGVSVDEYRKNVSAADKDWNNYLHNGGEHTKLMEKYNKAIVEDAKKLINAYDTAESRTKKNVEMMKTYDDKLANYTEGAYDKVVSTVKASTNDWTYYSLQKLKDTINAQGQELKDYTMLYNTTNEALAQSNRETAEKNLNTLAEELSNRTNTIHDLSQDEIDAWKALSDSSYNAYQIGLSKCPEEMRKRIEAVTGVIYQKTPDVSSATEKMANEVIARLDKDEAFRNEALNSMYGYLNGLSNSDLRSLLTAAGIQDVDKVMEGIRAGNLAEDEGKKILTSLNNGLNSGAFKGTLFNTARDIASGIANRLSVKFNVSGLNNVFKTITGFLPGHKLGLDYVPKNNYVARLHKGERVLTAEENKEYTEAEEESRKRNSTSVVHTTNVAANNEIVERILETNSKMVTLLQRILETNNKSIVLDTGELVGATADKYNIELERIRRKDERGS